MVGCMEREDFMDLFDLKDSDEAMEYYDECRDEGKSWYEIAKSVIYTMDNLIRRQ